MCFKKKPTGDTVQKNRELISMNERMMEALVVLAGKNEEYVAALRATREKIKYLTPSGESKVTDYDKKIKALIEDLKIVLTKAAGEELPQRANTLLTQIEVAVSERKAVI